MTDEKNPIEQAVEQALDVFVYAPIGLLFDGPALLPSLIERGKNQVNTARVIGQFAVQQGQVEAQKQVAKLQEQATGFLALLGNRNDRAPEPPARRPAAPAEPKVVRPTSGDSSGLAIPDYDSLSASQVVNRLAGLAGDELEAVRAYEAAHRGR